MARHPKYTGLTGRAPLDHPRRCQANRKVKGPCRMWALKGEKYCRFHGGASMRARRKQPHSNARLPMFYKGKLTKTLRQAVEDALQLAPHEQINLFEELALTRINAGEAVALWSLVQEKEGVSLEDKAEAGAIMQLALREVVSTCESAARVQALGRDKITIHDLANTVSQIVRIAHDVFGSDIDKAKEFEEAVRNKVKVAATTEGTDIKPDDDVLEMDGTIPRE